MQNCSFSFVGKQSTNTGADVHLKKGADYSEIEQNKAGAPQNN